MYEVDDKDQVIELTDVPGVSIGAPNPTVVSNEAKVLLAYYLQDTPEDWDGSTVRVVDHQSQEPAAIVEFKLCYAHMFGPPGEDVFEGHPLYDRGLMPFRVYEIKNSSWLRKLERLNAVDEYHDPGRFWQRHHFVFAFHDSTFECIADGFDITETYGSMEELLPLMSEKLWAR